MASVPAIPDMEEVRRLLEPHESAITRFYLDAWSALRAMKGAPQPMYLRTRASLLHNFVMNTAIPGLADAGVHIIEKHETAFFVVDGRLLFRLKKGDERGITSNVDSQASLAFTDLEKPLSLLADLPDVWRVDISYILNSLDTLIERIVVVARDVNRVLWSYSFYPDVGAREIPQALPVAPRMPLPADSGMRVPDADRVDEQTKKGA
jgi:hypothetical protein